MNTAPAQTPAFAGTEAAMSATDREVAEMAEFIVGLAHEPATDGLIRRAVRNVYNLGRTHEAIAQVQRMEDTKLLMLRGVVS